ncbi:2-amino-4-hydroxy-6-hydroxymethyldihydropteridine diphosphokinase [uncultured Fretibacterium sp.]|uniref:2-amino-4-hydroxy-6- hydroxymethyldihydropteridine diphosphokinase n=1 Tax=uncultured Fretibacterium sp. TaxID=1678694 RepID=UPI002633E037|nr:2-amino-4-hydroxy-6-hydroxymethyldihydropteridine diphosphokinase [uncultured Fretibacterium sp.]
MAVLALGLGTNLGNRLGNLRQAARAIEEDIGPILRASEVFETEPWGVTDQPHFLNACLCLDIDGESDPEALLAPLKAIERRMGRKETIRWGARLIDIDILLIGDRIYESPALRIPHLHLSERSFVLTPLIQILPGWNHPLTGKSLEEMSEALKDEPSPLRIGPF